MKTFNVLEYNWNSWDISQYDVLPCFRNTWNSKKFNFEKKEVKTKKHLKEWIKRVSHYYFWARCEYEFLMAPWPYRERKLYNYIPSENDDDDTKHLFKIIVDDNVVVEESLKKKDGIPHIFNTEDLKKIDVHQQIMMNIDIITDILSEEFKIK